MKQNFLKREGSDYVLIIISVVGLLGIGLTMVLSASSVNSIEQFGNAYSIFIKQSLFVAIGILGTYISLRISDKKWLAIGRLSLILGSAILTATVVLGKEINGNRNWIPIGPFLIQPSEFAKLALILFVAFQLNKSEKGLLAGKKINPILSIVPVTLIFIGLILLGKDVGTALIFAGIAGALLILAGIKYRYIAFTLIPLAVGLTVLVMTAPNRIKRFKALIDPFAPDVYKLAGWQPAHSLMGLASGGLFGVGIGDSKQKWANLAEAHTDFIFSVIGEEMGLFGTLLVITLYAALIFAIFRTSLKCKSGFDKYAIAGIGSWLALQISINLATNVGIVPVVGVTLPFISYGGSSVIADLIAIGFVLRVALQQGGVNINNKFSRKIAS